MPQMYTVNTENDSYCANPVDRLTELPEPEPEPELPEPLEPYTSDVTK